MLLVRVWFVFACGRKSFSERDRRNCIGRLIRLFRASDALLRNSSEAPRGAFSGQRILKRINETMADFPVFPADEIRFVRHRTVAIRAADFHGLAQHSYHSGHAPCRIPGPRYSPAG